MNNLKILFLLLALFTSVFLINQKVNAETPCTYLGHDSIQAMMACAGGAQGSNSAYMNAHHNQMINALSRSDHLPPQPYSTVGNEAFYTTMAVAGAMFSGFGYGKPLVYPWMSYYGGFYNRLPTDIITYNE